MPPRAKRQTSVGARRANGIEVEWKPTFQCILSDLRRKSTAECLGRSPGSEGAARVCWSLHLPRPMAEWLFEATLPHSQWRDRAGITPDFPVRPLVGTKASAVVSPARVDGQDTIGEN